MDVDTADKKYFAFEGFPGSADPHEIFVLSQEHVADYLGEFSLEVRGVAAGEGAQSVAVKFKGSDEEKLKQKINEVSEHFMFRGKPLQTVTTWNPRRPQFQMPSTTCTIRCWQRLNACKFYAASNRECKKFSTAPGLHPSL